MALTQIRVITVYVTDQDAAVAHYRDVLGLEIRRDVPMGKGRWIEAAIPGDSAVLMLADAAEFGRSETGGFAPCTLECDDAQTTRDELAARGADVSDIEAEHWGTHFYMRDLDGNNFLVRETPREA